MENYINNIEELVGKSLEYFKSNFDMPKEGIFAGGALANYINYLITGKTPIINDIDVFSFKESIIDEQYHKYNHKIVLGDISPIQETNMGDYTHVVFEHKDATYYKLDKTERVDKINFVYTITNNLAKKLNIIESFDINQTQIAIDLETNEIYYTNHFVEFLNTQRLDITYIQSPIHSILRAMKKAEESNLLFDAQYYISLYKEMKHFVFHEKIKRLFGEKYKLMYDKYQSIFIENGFSINITKHYYDKNNMPIYYVSPLHEANLRCVHMYEVIDINYNDNKFVFPDILDAKSRISYKVSLSMFYDMHTKHFGKSKKMWGLFKKFKSFFYKTNYVDMDINNDDDILKMKKIYQYQNILFPCLYDKTMTEQLHFISLYELLDNKDKELINKYTPPISPIDIYDMDEKIFLMRLKKQK